MPLRLVVHSHRSPLLSFWKVTRSRTAWLLGAEKRRKTKWETCINSDKYSRRLDGNPGISLWHYLEGNLLQRSLISYHTRGQGEDLYLIYCKLSQLANRDPGKVKWEVKYSSVLVLASNFEQRNVYLVYSTFQDGHFTLMSPFAVQGRARAW